MVEYVAGMPASTVCIKQSSGNTYVYIKEPNGVSHCYTIIGDVKCERGKIEVISHVDTVESNVRFPLDS